MKLTRHASNPILRPEPRNPWENFAVCNPGVWFENGVFSMLYRAAGDDPAHRIYFGLASSRDGVRFERVSDQPAVSPSVDGPDAGCVEDPRIVKFGTRFYITYAYRPFPPGRYWLNPGGLADMPKGPAGAPRLVKENLTNSGVLMSDDLRHFHRLGRLTEPNSDNRDVVFFPEKVNGRHVLLHRKKELPGTQYPAIWISFLDDLMEYNDGVLLAKNAFWWETKLGAGCPPLRTDAGWLMIYHGVCARGVYRAGAMLLDLDDPRKIIGRTPEPILEPECEFERSGIWSDCVFPTGNVIVDGILHVYYGAGDKCICLATCRLDDLLDDLLGRGKTA
ncbi:MAG: glycosidase [Verrucomicrobiae bacterium]|nr:glycosidase [Verrucomicrobiae bacterium]